MRNIEFVICTVNFRIGLVALCLLAFVVAGNAQIIGPKNDSTRVRKPKKERQAKATLPADTLPSVYNIFNRNTDAESDTTIRKKSKKEKRPRIDTVNVYNESTYTVVKHPEDSVVIEKPKRRFRFDRSQDTSYPETDTVEAIASVPLTPDQIAAMLLDSGNHYLSKSNYERSIFFFDSLILHYPYTFQHRLAYYFRGKARMAINQDVPAMVDFNLFNQLDKCQSNFCTDAHYNLAVLKFRNGRVDECLTELQQVMRDTTYKNYRYTYFYRGFCYGKKENYVPAIQDLTRFIELDGGRTYASAEALYFRGFYKSALDDNRGAIKDYDESIRLYETGGRPGTYQQKLIDTYIVRALSKAKIKKYDEAIADYNMVIKLDPKYATAHRLKGLAEIAKGDKDNGCLSLSRAGELGSNEAYDDIKQHCR